MRRFVVVSAVTVVVTAAFLSGSGVGSSAAVVGRAQGIPSGLAAAIHARFGAGAIRSSSAASFAQGPFLGYSISVSADGTTALVGAPFAHRFKGGAFVFHVSDAGSWTSSATPTATLTNPGTAGKQYFGFGVALSADGTTAFVGAPLVGAGFGPAGAIYVFHVSAEDAWASSSTPTATLTASSDFLGISLAVSADGTTIVAGAPIYHGQAGGAYVYQAVSENQWASTSTPTAVLSNAGEDVNDEHVGLLVAIAGDGTTVLLSDTDNPSGGGAYLYHVAAEGLWATGSSSTPTAILSDANRTANDFLGDSLALSGDGTVALLGAPADQSVTGAVDVFHASGAVWVSTSTPTATLTNAGGSANDTFGVRVAMSTDGTTALVTAPGRNRARGAAYVFRVSDEGAWASSSAPTATLTHSAGHVGDELAIAALSSDGATALVGAPGVRFQTGAVDVFHVADATSWASSSTPGAILTVSALNQCVVPKLKGLKVRAAKAALKARSCRLGRVRRVMHAGGRRGRVFSQSASPGVRVAVGAKIAVKVKK